MSFIFIFLSLLPARAAIFGADSRRPVAASSAWAGAARATAVAVLNTLVTVRADGRVDLDVSTLAGSLCAEEKLSRESSIPYACTGFLVAPDLLVTAGHCSVNFGEVRDETEGYCGVYRWVFDYGVNAEGRVETSSLPAENLYSCKKILYAVNDDAVPDRDYAVIQLDRAVTNRRPLTLATTPVARGESVTLLGHPLGSPLKIADGARVTRDDPHSPVFETNLDALDGDSGGPVFNSRREVVGILVRGTPSPTLLENPKRSCSTINRCASAADCANFSSDVQRIAPIVDILTSSKGRP